MRTSLLVGIPLTLALGIAGLAAAASPAPSATDGPSPLPSPSIWPDCPTGPTPRPVSDPEDAEAARSALQAYLDDVAAGRLREAWERLSADTQATWGSFEVFAPDQDDVIVSDPEHEPDMRCSWLAGAADYGDADLSRVYVIAVTGRDDLDDGPGAPYIRPDSWVVAPLPDGTWGLWQIR